MKRLLLSISLALTTLFSMAQSCEIGVVNVPMNQCVAYGDSMVFSVVPGTMSNPLGRYFTFLFVPVPGAATGGTVMPGYAAWLTGFYYPDSLPIPLWITNDLNGELILPDGEPMYGEWLLNVYLTDYPFEETYLSCDSLEAWMHINFLEQGDTACDFSDIVWVAPHVTPATSACDGSVSVSVLGGTPPLEYTFSNGQSGSSNQLSGLCSGVYSVSVVDAVGASASATFVISLLNNTYFDPQIATFLNPDTAFISAIQNCDLDYNAPIDSFFISQAIVIGGDTLTAEWAIWQGGVPFIVVGEYPYLPNGEPVLALTLYCMNGRSAMGSFQLYAALPENVGIHEEEKQLALQVYPNPNTGLCAIRFDVPQTGQLSVHDAVGRNVLQRSFSNSTMENLDLSAYSNGLYFMEVRTEKGERYQGKVVKE